MGQHEPFNNVGRFWPQGPCPLMPCPLMSYHCSLSQFATPSREKASRGAPAWLLARLKEEQDRLYCVQPYSSLDQFAAAHRLVLPRGHWRLTHRQVGWIHGLETSSFGHLTATNGVLCYVEQGGGSVFLGHIQNWVQFKDEESAPVQTTKQASKKVKEFAEFDL